MKTTTENVFELFVSKTTTEKKEIKLPFYCKTSGFAFKIISKDDCVQVEHSPGYRGFGIGIRISPASVAFSNEGKYNWHEISEAEFKDIYIDVINRLGKLAA